MRIKKVYAHNFRKFLQPVCVDDIASGVCVIAGDNEEGKSTIVQAIRSAFHMKHSTQSTQHIQPYNSSALPEVAVEFDLNGMSYYLRKTFGKKGTAELRTHNSVFTGSEAEEKLQELCNVSPEKKESSIWNVLWIEQGTTFCDMRLGDGGKRTLQSALEKELGSIVGGDEGQTLFKSIQELYLKWFTATGRDSKNSDHKQAEERLAEIDLQLQRASVQFEELQSMLTELDRARAKIRQYDERRTLDLAKQQLDALHKRKAEVDKQRQEFKQAEQIERTEMAQHQNAAMAWKQRSALSQECESIANRIKSIEKQSAESAAVHKESSERLHQYQQTRAALDAAYEEALAQYETAERTEQLRQLKLQIANLQLAHERAAHAEQECKRIKKEGQAIKIDRPTIGRLRQTERQLLQAEAQLEVVATKLELLPIKGTKETLVITERTEVPLAGWGDLIVTPGGGDTERLRGNREKLRESFSALLAQVGVTSVQEADELEHKRTQLGLEYQSFARDLQQYAPAGLPALADQVAALNSQHEELLQKAGDIAADAIDLAAARTKRDESRLKLNQTKAAAEKCEQEFRDADRLLQSLGVQLKSAQEDLERVQSKLASERSAQPDDKLFQSSNEAELRLQAASKRRRELEDALKELNPESTERDIESAQKNIQNLSDEIQQLREAQSRLEGSLQTLGRTGITEEVAKLKGKKEQAEKQFSRASLKARAIKLLYETLVESEKNSKQQLAEPLMRRLEPYISELFSNSTFSFDNGSFSVVQLERGSAEPFQNLSLGTREQISVLTRLAFAEVLSESGYPAVVILDDALVYSDETRFERMQEVLKRASEKFQIIVMTCRERDYANMGVPLIKLAECVGKRQQPTLEGLLLSNQRLATPTHSDQVRP